MLQVSKQQFEYYMAEALDSIPDKYFKRIENVVFVAEDYPTKDQIIKINLRPGHSLFGLYEGIPLPSRNSSYNLVIPDRITIFRKPMLIHCVDELCLRKQIHKTIWHEVAHYFGLSHEAMDKLGGV
jgi:predicted Zn-dependent protease with MMP-like domain